MKKTEKQPEVTFTVHRVTRLLNAAEDAKPVSVLYKGKHHAIDGIVVMRDMVALVISDKPMLVPRRSAKRTSGSEAGPNDR